jgi:hypothetical protein
MPLLLTKGNHGGYRTKQIQICDILSTLCLNLTSYNITAELSVSEARIASTKNIRNLLPPFLQISQDQDLPLCHFSLRKATMVANVRNRFRFATFK